MHPRILGHIPEADFNTTIANWRVFRAGATPADNRREPPTLAEIGMAHLIGRITRLVVGAATPIAELQAQLEAAQAAVAAATAAQPPATAASAAGMRKGKLSAVLSQIDESEAVVMTETDMVACYLRYAAVFGSNEKPPKETERTVEQVSAIRHLLRQNCPPYCDFSIFGPYGHRLVKKIKLSGLMITKEGTLSTIELHGPPSITMWQQSYQVWLNVMVMLDAADLGTLMKYKDKIEKLHDRYSDKIWAILYQADVRCRLEAMDRIRRQILAEQEQLNNAHAVVPGPVPTVPGFEPNRPWNLVIQRAVSDDEFWREEVIEPGMMVLTKVSGLNDYVEGDAKIGLYSSSQSSGVPAHADASLGVRSQSSGVKPRPRKQSRTGRHHAVENGVYTANRTGYALCDAYNKDQCGNAVNGCWCPSKWDHVHQCSRCLGTHPVTRCPYTEMPAPKFIKNRDKGKGKSKKGKGKGPGPQYWPDGCDASMHVENSKGDGAGALCHWRDWCGFWNRLNNEHLLCGGWTRLQYSCLVDGALRRYWAICQRRPWIVW